ncbi:MAG: SDR family oxidoreductase [Pseudomonadota bacterium]
MNIFATPRRCLDGKVAIVTGGSQGLGFEIARQYVEAGASLLVCARDASQLEASVSNLHVLLTPGQKVVAVVGDVATEQDVEHICSSALTSFGRIDVLVNNAGIQGPMGKLEDVDWREWVRTIEVNVLGSVLMARAVAPTMRAQGSGKILQLSGGGATSAMPGMSAYAVSKAAIVRFVETLAEELQGSGIDVNAIAPGAVNTRMLDQVLAAGADKVGSRYFEKALQQKISGGASIQEAAALAVFLASAASDGITGRLISAVWDNWRNLTERKRALAESDVYTLRRITTRDRGLDWGDR